MRKPLMAAIGAAALITATLSVNQSATAATILYTSPTGAGSACTQMAPCSLPEAVANANNGDTIQLTADEYNLTSTLNITDDNLTIAGPSGTIQPGDFIAYIMFGGGLPTTDSKINVSGRNVRFERVAITGTADGSAHIVRGDGATFDRVLMMNFGASDTLRGWDVTVTNSVIAQTGASSGAAAAMSGTITGSTIYSQRGTAILQTPGYVAAPFCSTVVRNTLAWGESSNLTVNNVGGTCASIDVDIDYSWVSSLRSASTGGGWTIGGGSQSVSAGPDNLPNSTVVFDPTDPSDTYISDLVLPPDSPAINAGCTVGCSEHDYYGRPRPIGDANDIGAAEQALAPSVSAVTPQPRGATQAGLEVSINPRGAASTYAIQYRKAGDPTWTTHLEGDITSALFFPSSVSATLTGLSPDTAYEARVTSRNDRGEATPSLVSFRTGTASLAVTGLKAKLTKKKGKLTSRVTVSDPGSISQVAKAGRSPKTRCRTTRAAADAGVYGLTCALNKKTRKELRKKSLKFKVTTTLKLADGSTISRASKVKAKRKR